MSESQDYDKCSIHPSFKAAVHLPLKVELVYRRIFCYPPIREWSYLEMMSDIGSEDLFESRKESLRIRKTTEQNEHMLA